MTFFFLGFFTEPVETSQMAENAPDTNIFFVPGFNGLQAPINDPSATAGFIGKYLYNLQSQTILLPYKRCEKRTYVCKKMVH